MKNIYKMICKAPLMMVIVSLLSVGLVGCGSLANETKEVEMVVATFMKDFSSMNFDNASNYTTDDGKKEIEALKTIFDNQVKNMSRTEIAGIKLGENNATRFAKIMYENISYKIIETNITDNEAKVKYELLIPDFTIFSDTKLMGETLGINTEEGLNTYLINTVGKSKEEFDAMDPESEERAEAQEKVVLSITEDLVEFIENNMGEPVSDGEPGYIGLTKEDGKWKIASIQ